MKQGKPRPASLEKDIRWLLDELCVDWGFCIPPADAARIARSNRLAADEFAAQVLRVEGMEPEREVEWFRRIKRQFTDRFGSSISGEHKSVS